MIKDYQVQLKAGPDDGLADGTFTAYASVFGNRDSYGDIVEKGAFAKTLANWQKSGAPIPLYFGHNMTDPDFNIGSVEAVEDEHGLLVTGSLDLDNPKAAQTYRLLKGRRINQMSFGYEVVDGTQKDGDYLLKELNLFEVSVVPIGANQETEVLAVKAMAERLAAKAGKVLSTKNETKVREAIDALQEVLKANGAEDNDQEQASGTDEAKSGASDEEPNGAKSSASDEEPSPNPSVSDAWRRKFNLYSTAFAVEEGASR